MNKTIFKVIFGLILTLSFCGMVILKQYYAFERPASPQARIKQSDFRFSELQQNGLCDGSGKTLA